MEKDDKVSTLIRIGVSGESSFWYRPTRVVPDQRLLNGRCCCCCYAAFNAPFVGHKDEDSQAVTVGLASHWPYITDFSGLSTNGLAAYGRETGTPPTLLMGR